MSMVKSLRSRWLIGVSVDTRAPSAIVTYVIRVKKRNFAYIFLYHTISLTNIIPEGCTSKQITLRGFPIQIHSTKQGFLGVLAGGGGGGANKHLGEG